jgi:hypothetical protein
LLLLAAATTTPPSPAVDYVVMFLFVFLMQGI